MTFRTGGRPPFNLILAVGLCLALLQTVPATARQAAGGQRRLNELAAAQLRAYMEIVELTGLRRPGERLEPYVERVAAPLLGESRAKYEARESLYIAALQRAAEADRLCTRVPILKDAGAGNAASWQKAVRASSHLQERVARVKAVWSEVKASPEPGGEYKRLGQEMAGTLLTIKTAYDGFRDARP